MTQWLQLANDLAVLQLPWRAFGIDFRRNVTLLRLPGGQLIIHSTAPFSADDLTAMRAFGDPTWLVEATNMHDTFARVGRAALPKIPYLVPRGFPQMHLLKATPLTTNLPNEWASEVDVLPLAGLRLTNEHVFFHRASRTLVLADSLSNFSPAITGWARLFVTKIMRLPRLTGLSIFFRLLIRDQAAFAGSMQEVFAWDFEKIVVGHAEPICENGKAILRAALRDLHQT